MPARPSASETSPTSCSWAWNSSPAAVAAAFVTPGWERSSASARRSSAVRSR